MSTKFEPDAHRAYHGGSWAIVPRYSRAAYRVAGVQSLRDFYLGLRLVRRCP